MSSRFRLAGAVAPPARGSGRCRTVLLIPGLNGIPDLLEAEAPRLLPGFRTVSFDHRLDLGEDGLEGLAERALMLLDRQTGDKEPVLVSGESFGGPVALTLARRHPGRVRGLLLFSTFARYPLADAQPLAAALEAWKRYGDNLPDEPATALLRRLALPAQVGLDCPPRLREAYLKQPSAHLPAVRAKCSLSLQFDGRPWLRDLQVPAFVLSGTQDRVVPPSAGRELAGRLLFGRFHLLRGGHLVHIVQAARVGRLVRAWAQELLDEVTQAPGLAQVLPLSS